MAVFTETSWTLDDEVTSEKLQAMSQSDIFLRDELKGMLKPWGSNWPKVNPSVNGASIASPTDTELYYQAGSKVVTVESSGVYSSSKFFWPTSFPNGLLTCTLTAGEIIGHIIVQSYEGDRHGTLVAFLTSWSTAGTIGIGTPYRINFVAIGY